MGYQDRNRQCARLCRLAVIGSLFFVPLGAFAGEFQQCLSGLQNTALESGISKSTVAHVFPTINKRAPVIESDRNQPEFTQTFGDYLRGHVTDRRIKEGRALLVRHADLLARLERRYGVQRQYLVAFWGLETNYGHFLGSIPVFDSLATLACDDRRGRYFSGEFLSALKIFEDDRVPLERMTGSWAGAIGQTQFMPSTYVARGVDGDGDGVVDLWRSTPDALASAANLLQSLGWQSGWRWGREVLLPAGFAYYQAGLDQSKSLKHWRQEGVREVSGRPVAALDAQASLLVPAGHEGPAFLVYRNFNVIMRWNRSEYFALAVARLADRVAGAGQLHVPPPNEPAIMRSDIKTMQQRLNELGFDSGTPDGIVGSQTRQAVRQWQKNHGLIADGYVNTKLLHKLDIG